MLKSDHPAMTLLLGILVAIAPLTMDIYLPSMPAMAHALSATPEAVQLTVTIYMFGWGFAQLVAGPLSDRFGRRPALLAGLIVFTIASIGCALATDIGFLIAARVAQAVGVATVAVVPRAVVRDLHSGDKAAHMLSTMMMVLAIAPIVAPILGAQLHLAFGWQSNFVAVAAYGLVALAAVHFLLPETLFQPDREALRPSIMLGNWRHVLRSRRFVGFLGVIALANSGLFAFLAGSSFVFVAALGQHETAYALYFGLVMLGNIIGATLARRIVVRIGLERMIGYGCAVLALSGIAMAALAWLGMRHPLAIVLPMLAFMTAYMWVVPQATAGALTPYPSIAGSAASLVSFAQFVIAAAVATLVGVAFDGTSRAMASAIGLCGLCALAVFRTMILSDRGNRGLA